MPVEAISIKVASDASRVHFELVVFFSHFDSVKNLSLLSLFFNVIKRLDADYIRVGHMSHSVYFLYNFSLFRVEF